MVTITQTWCENAGLNKMVWNGIVPEYWITLHSEPETDRAFDYRLGIEFFEEIDGERPFVQLVTPRTKTPLKGVSTPEDFQQAYRLISGREMPGVE